MVGSMDEIVEFGHFVFAATFFDEFFFYKFGFFVCSLFNFLLSLFVTLKERKTLANNLLDEVCSVNSCSIFMHHKCAVWKACRSASNCKSSVFLIKLSKSLDRFISFLNQ